MRSSSALSLAFPLAVLVVLGVWLWNQDAAQASHNGWFMADVTLPTPTPVNVPQDWSGQMKAYWSFDNTATSQGTCGTPCDLVTLSGDTAPSYSTTTGKIMGTHAIHIDYAKALVSCAGGASCNNWAPADNGSVTISGFYYDVRDDNGMQMDARTGTNGGFEIQRGAAADRFTCSVWSTGKLAASTSATFAINTQRYFACRLSGNNGTADVWMDGALSNGASPNAVFWVRPGSTDKIRIGTDDAGTADSEVYIDDLSIMDFVAGPQTMCRLCSCGVKGDVSNGGLCACDVGGVTYSNDGRRTTGCGSCTLPACNTPAPSTS